MKLLLTGMIFPLFITSQAGAKTLTFSAISTSKTPEVGILVLHEAYGQMGIRPAMKKLPGERALRAANSGKTDGELHRIKAMMKPYTNLIRVDVPINHIEGVAYTKDPSLTVRNWQDLGKVKSGGVRGIKWFEKNTKGIAVQKYASFSDLFKALKVGRIQVGMANRINGITHIAGMGLTGVTPIEPPLVRLPLYHYLHKRHKELVPRLTTILQTMEKKGRIAAIRRQALAAMAAGRPLPVLTGLKSGSPAAGQ